QLEAGLDLLVALEDLPGGADARRLLLLQRGEGLPGPLRRLGGGHEVDDLGGGADVDLQLLVADGGGAQLPLEAGDGVGDLVAGAAALDLFLPDRPEAAPRPQARPR